MTFLWDSEELTSSKLKVAPPYVPLIMTPLVYDPVNFTPRKGVMTRYAKKMVRPEFYGKVIVADVDKV